MEKESKGQALLEDFYPLVSLIVSQVERRLPTYANCEDLHSAGVKGLVVAYRRYSTMETEQLKRYLAVRIRGAVLDELRKNDPLSRTARRRARAYAEAESALRQQFRREPTENEIREEMELTPREFAKLKNTIQPRTPLRLDEQPESSARDVKPLRERLTNPAEMNPLQQVEKHEMVSGLLRHLDKLSEREQFLIKKYYFDSWRLGDIAQVFGVSEARACQLHSRALRNLRLALEQD